MSHLNIPRPLTAAVSEMTSLVDTFRHTENAELVISLGNEGSGGSWSEGVGEIVFDEILETLCTYDAWGNVGWWEDFHEYTYTVDSNPVVTKVRMCKEMSTLHGVHHPVSFLHMNLLNHGRAKGCVRYTTHVDVDTLPDTVAPSRVRILKEKRFSRDPWEFVFTKAWCGNTRTDAEVQQSKGNMVHSIDIVFSPPSDYWESTKHSSSYVATSMLMKMVNILSSEMFHIEPVDIK